MADPIQDLGEVSANLSLFESLPRPAYETIVKLFGELDNLKLKLSEAVTENKNLREFHESSLAEVRDENRQLREFIQNSIDENYNSPTVVRRKVSKRSDSNSNQNSTTCNNFEFNAENAATNFISANNLHATTMKNSVANSDILDHRVMANQIDVNSSANDFVPVVSRNAAKKNKKKVIQAIDTSLESVLKIVKVTKCEGFSLKQNSMKSPIKISIEKAEEIPAIRDALKSNNISFHEFKWDSEKQQGFLIRGLVGLSESAVPDVLEELVKAGVPASAKLSLYKTGFMRSNPEMKHNPLLKLVVPPDFDAKLLKSIRYLDHVAVSFEKINSKSVVQCFNCQRFGHSAAGCQHAHRCVKCGENHYRDSCPRTFSKGIKLICCNCGGDHTANNLSVCPFFINNFGKKKHPSDVPSKSVPAFTSKKLPTPTAKRSTDAARSPVSTYADILKEPSGNHTKSLQNFSELSRKIDIIYQLVMKHEADFQDLRHG